MLTNGKRRYVPIPVESNTAKMLLLLRPLREKGDIGYRSRAAAVRNALSNAAKLRPDENTKASSAAFDEAAKYHRSAAIAICAGTPSSHKRAIVYATLSICSVEARRGQSSHCPASRFPADR